MQELEPGVTRAAFGDVNGRTFGVDDAIGRSHTIVRDFREPYCAPNMTPIASRWILSCA